MRKQCQVSTGLQSPALPSRNQMITHVEALSHLEELYNAPDHGRFAQVSLSLAERLFRSSTVTWHKVDLATGATAHSCHDRRTTAAIQSAWHHFASQSPVVRYYQRGGTDPIINTQELISDLELRNSGLYSECWRPFGVKYQVGLRLRGPNYICGLSIKRELPFSPAESLELRSWLPHFQRAWRRLPQTLSISGRLKLTKRESEVLQWVAAGKRDSEIGIILGMATKTVGKHVEHILSKLGVETRTAAAVNYLDGERPEGVAHDG